MNTSIFQVEQPENSQTQKVNIFVYSPYFQKNIPVCISDIKTLEAYAEAASELRDSIPNSCEMYHMWEAFAQACLETLDSMRGRGNDIY